MNSLHPPATSCDYCGLPVAGGVGVEPCYCCSGCRLAASITGAGGADGQARWLMTKLGLAVFFAMNVMVFTFLLWSEGAAEGAGGQARALYDLARYASLVFSVPVLFLLGGPLVESAAAEVRRGRLSIDLLLVAGVAAAFGISAWATWQGEGHVYFEVACMVLVAVTLGRWLEASGKLETTAALRSLESLLPDRVRRVRRGERAASDAAEAEVPLAEVEVGDVLRLLPGEQVPTDGLIEAGLAAFDERTVSGESEPVVRGAGAAIKSGTTNLDGEILMAVTAPPGAGTLETLIAAVTAAVRESRCQRLADRLAGWFLPAVLVAAAATAAFHGWRSGLAAGVMAGLAVVVVSCPCALGLATPLALWAALGRCMRRQVLVREGDALERLAGVSDFCFDKTGTLTTGCRVERLEVAPGHDREATLAVAAGLARGSTHAAAEAIAALAAAAGVTPAAMEDVRSVAGMGVEGRLAGSGEAVRLGSPRWDAASGEGLPVPSRRTLPAHILCSGRSMETSLRHPGFARFPTPARLARATPLATPCAAAELEASARAEPRCVLVIGKEPVAAFWTAEEIRPSAAVAVAGLAARGRAVTILSGDQPARVAAVADSLRLSWQAPLLPAEKLAVIEQLRRDGAVAMVGDGINDAAALAAADVGIALGCGADVARWTAPICLLDDDLGSLPWLLDLARATRRTIRWNLLWAFGYNAACIPLAATGLVHPALAALAMVASSLLVVGNSLTLGRAEPGDETASLSRSTGVPPRPTRAGMPEPAEAGA